MATATCFWVAEEMIFGDVSTGAQNDLQKATEIARTMVTQFGMSERLGLVALEGRRRPPFLPVAGQPSKEYSEETARIVDEEINRLLTDAQQKVRSCLSSCKDTPEDLAQLLLEKEVVERPALQSILIAKTTKDARGVMPRGQSPSDGGPIGKRV